MASVSGKLDESHQGSRAELLAELVLSNIALTTPVPSRADIGVDLFCSLYDINGEGDENLQPNSMFSVQVKKKEYFALKRSNINYLASLEIPHFVAIVDVVKRKVSLYSFQQFSHILQKCGNPAINFEEHFVFEIEPVDEYSKTHWEKFLSTTITSGVSPRIQIGPKVIEMVLDDFEKLEERKKAIEKLKDWIMWERKEITDRRIYFPVTTIRISDEGKIVEERVLYYHEKHYEEEVYVKALRATYLLKCHLNKSRKEIPKSLQEVIDFCEAKNGKEDEKVAFLRKESKK